MKKVKVFGSYILEKDKNNNIQAIISPWERKIEVGQRVISNGRILPDGAGGIVVKIHQPYVGHRTSDVIEVLFDGQEIPVSMKFKDLL